MGTENKVLMVIAPRDFRDEEFEQPKTIFEDSGLTVVVASSTVGECYGVNGLVANSEVDFSMINPQDFDAIIFVGGSGVEQFFEDQQILMLAKEFSVAGKLVSAICWAPVILGRAGLLEGKKATVWPDAKDDIIKSGANYTGELIEVDGLVITASSSDSAEIFAQRIVSLLLG